MIRYRPVKGTEDLEEAHLRNGKNYLKEENPDFVYLVYKILMPFTQPMAAASQTSLFWTLFASSSYAVATGSAGAFSPTSLDPCNPLNLNFPVREVISSNAMKLRQNVDVRDDIY